MKQAHFLFVVSLFTLILNSCDKSPELLKKIEGNWYCNYEGIILKETWESSGAKQLSGIASKIENGEEKVAEYLEVKMEGDKLVYIASVVEQNDGKPITFKESVQSSNSITFVNAEHDFPQYITYEVIDDLNLLVTIGMLPSEISKDKMEFRFSRKLPDVK